MKSAIYAFITQYSLIKPGQTVIVGLSGGPDSVCLLHLLHSLKDKLNITLIAAHLNHGWRSEAENDRLFCQNLCQRFDIPFESAHASDLAIAVAHKKSLEEQGRLLRRFYFTTLKQKYNAAAIALGHHQNDQIETFFIRLIRGASLEGLGGMRPIKDEYIRPLLQSTKQEILHYLAENNLAYCIDSTNESSLFLRNRIRNVIPQLTECDQRFELNTLKAIQNLQETHDALQIIIAEKFAKITHIEYHYTTIDIKMFQNESAFMQKNLIALWLISEKVQCVMTVNFIHEILRFLTTDRGGTHAMNQVWSIVKKNNQAYIKKI